MPVSAPARSRTARLRVLVHEHFNGGGLAGQDGGHELLAEGHAMRRAVAADLAALPGVAVVMTQGPGGLPAQGPWTLARRDEARPGRSLRDLARRCDAALVIAPETGGMLASLADELDGTGVVPLGSSGPAIALATDKAAMALWLAERGVRVVPGRVVPPGEPWPADLAFPAVVKPLDGAGSLATFRVPHARALPPRAAVPGAALAQPWHPGRPASVALVAGPEGMSVVGTSHQIIDFYNFSYQYYGGRVPGPVPTSLAGRIARVLGRLEGFRGWVGVDVMVGPGRGEAAVLEVNPRLTTSYLGLRRWVAGGGPTLAARLLAAAGFAVEAPPLAAAPVPTVRSVRFAADGLVRVREVSA